MSVPKSAIYFLFRFLHIFHNSVKMVTYKKLGDKIRRLRKEKGFTQEKLAELAKIDPKSIIDIESGKRNPTLKTITKLARSLNISLNKLLSIE